MSDDHITQYPIFPAMEELIDRMPLNDLLILRETPNNVGVGEPRHSL